MPSSTSSTTSPARVRTYGSKPPSCGAGQLLRRPRPVRCAPTCSGCVRNGRAAPAPAGSGCAARWCARSSTAAGRAGCRRAFLRSARHPGLAVRRRRRRPGAGRSRSAVGFPTRAAGFGASHRGRTSRCRSRPTSSSSAGSPRSGAAAAPTHWHMRIARRALRQQRPVGGQHVAPVAVRVDLRHHARPPGRCSWSPNRLAHNRIRSAARSPTPRTPPRPVRRPVPARRPRRTCARASARAAQRSGWWCRPATGRPPAPRHGSPRRESSGPARSPRPRRRRPRSGLRHRRRRSEQAQRAPADVGGAAAVQRVDRTAAVPPPMHRAAQMRRRSSARSTCSPQPRQRPPPRPSPRGRCRRSHRNPASCSSPDCAASACNSAIADRTRR